MDVAALGSSIGVCSTPLTVSAKEYAVTEPPPGFVGATHQADRP